MIIAEVTKRAKATFDPDINDYQKNWIAQGKLWVSELRAEGLNETADTVEKHLKWFEDRANAG
jgi:hypothetical protein